VKDEHCFTEKYPASIKHFRQCTARWVPTWL
jgi:hypothetical protein